MKILSDVGDPKCVLTNAEFARFAARTALSDAAAVECVRAAGGGADGAYADAVVPLALGEARRVTDAVLRWVRASPAGGQSVGACCRLRDRLKEEFGGVLEFSEEEIVQICNMRAGHTDILEIIMPKEKVEILSQETWDAVLGVINETLEPRPS